MEQHFGLWNPGRRREISFRSLVEFTSGCLLLYYYLLSHQEYNEDTENLYIA